MAKQTLETAFNNETDDNLSVGRNIMLNAEYTAADLADSYMVDLEEDLRAEKDDILLRLASAKKRQTELTGKLGELGKALGASFKNPHYNRIAKDMKPAVGITYTIMSETQDDGTGKPGVDVEHSLVRVISEMISVEEANHKKAAAAGKYSRGYASHPQSLEFRDTVPFNADMKDVVKDLAKVANEINRITDELAVNTREFTSIGLKARKLKGKMTKMAAGAAVVAALVAALDAVAPRSLKALSAPK